MLKSEEPTTADILELVRRGQRVRSAVARGGPKRIGDILSQVMARKGYAQVKSSAEVQEAWKAVAGGSAQTTRVGALRGGILNIYVDNHALIQELTFRKQELISALAKRLPRHRLKDIKFRTGAGK